MRQFALVPVATVVAVLVAFDGVGRQAAVAAVGDELYKVTWFDSSPDRDNFGSSMAASGNTVIIGSSGDNFGGLNSGSAYLFDLTSGSQLAEFIASDTSMGDRFGTSVGISGNAAIVGAIGDDDADPTYWQADSGAAYLFDLTTRRQTHKLTASDMASGDKFGASVAVWGNTAIVGAPINRDAGTDSGSAYLFDVASGLEIAKLTASDASAYDHFGTSVAVHGNTAIVGARIDSSEGYSAGSAYLFDVTTQTELAKLTASDATPWANFGSSVAVSGNIAVIGASGDSHAGEDSGSAYLFDVTTGEQLAKLVASDADAGDRFGTSVAINGDVVVVGASRNNDAGIESGSTYLFDVATGTQLARFTASDAEAGDRFGSSVAIGDSMAVVGAPYEDEMQYDAGAAYVFGVPEPSTFTLTAVSLLGLLAVAWRKRPI